MHSLFQIQVESTTTASIAERELVRRVEAHTGRRISQWEVTYSLYGPATGSEKRNVLESVTSTETPNRVVLISNTRVVESEDTFCAFQLGKLATYKQRSTRMIRGVAYDFVDFVVRVGLVFDRHNSASGVAVEIEYAPCAVVDDCAELIKELMERIATALVPPPQAGHETMAAKAAATTFRFAPVVVDFKQYFTTEKPFFTLRHSMLLYRKLLADPETEPRA